MKNILKNLSLFTIVVVCGFLLSGCTVSEEKMNEYNILISDANILIEGKEYTPAIEKLSTAVDLIPSRPEALQGIVDIFILKNRLEDATKLIDESGVELDDKDRSILYSAVGDRQYLVGNYERALYNYQLAKSMDSGNKEALLGLGKSYIQRGKIEEAKSMLQENFDGDMQIEAKLLLSYIEALSNFEKAKSSIKDIEPGDEWREEYSDWISVLDTLNEDVLFNGTKLGKYYIDAQYPYLTIALLEPHLNDMGEYIDGLYILGKGYFEYGEYDKSIEVLENLSTLSDLNQYIYWVLARCYYLKDDLNNATAYYDSAISYGGDKVEKALFKEYLDILIDENLTEKGLEVTKIAGNIFDEFWIQIYYMHIYSLRSDSEKFEYYMNSIDYEELDKAQKLEYLYLKGEYLIDNSELDEAQKTLDIFWELDKYNPGYNLLSAELFFERGQLDEARDFAKKAIEYDLDGEISIEAQKLLAQID